MAVVSTDLLLMSFQSCHISYNLLCRVLCRPKVSSGEGEGCITASENFLASGNICFRVLKLRLKVINKNVCYLCSV